MADTLVQQTLYRDVLTSLVPEGARILDLGCGDGRLLEHLARVKRTEGLGIDLDPRMIEACVAKGLPALQANLDEGLNAFPDNSFDVVILSHTLQVIRRADLVLPEILRIGRKAIVTVPNFGYWRGRFQLFFLGHMPVHKDLPYQWYDTPNIHLCTRKDFLAFCRRFHCRIERETALTQGRILQGPALNLRASELCYVLSREGTTA